MLGADSHNSFLSRLADVATFPSPPQPGYVRTLPGVNISYKREVLGRLGSQDETLFRGEDVDYNWRVQELGYKVYYDPAIRVTHYHRASVRQFLEQYYMYGRAYYQVRCKWSDMYRVYPHSLRQTKDFLKALNFAFGAFYQPLLLTVRLPRVSDWIRGYGVLWLTGVVWRVGIIRQAVTTRRHETQPIGGTSVR